MSRLPFWEEFLDEIGVLVSLTSDRRNSVAVAAVPFYR